MDISRIFAAAAPNALANYTSGLAAAAPKIQSFGITSPIRIANFLAQVFHECGRGTVLFEKMGFTTTARLLQIFGVGHHSAKVTAAEAPGLLRNGPKLAERVYGLGNPKKAKELGNTQPGDGFKYRGGGALQTTGRDAYRRMGNRIGVDLEAHPELIVDPAHAFIPALEEWNDGHLNAAADANRIRHITLVINGGVNGLPERKTLFKKVWSIASGGTPPPPFGD
ncbi:MAG: putative chitinase [Sphingomonadales bacterium]|jgi:putative chitinase|nr:putative chitinase [Sphingomonadales bacterium]